MEKSMNEFDRAWEEFFRDKPHPRSDEEDKKQLEEFHYWYNKVRKQSDTGKTPVEMGERVMGVDWDESGEEASLTPLSELLVKETKKVRKIGMLRGPAVKKYLDVLQPIESLIAEYFLKHQHITDKDVKAALLNFMAEPLREFDFSKNPIEHEVQTGAIVGAERKKISMHELRLLAEFLVFSIDNRDWLMNERAYLEWICAFMGYLDEKDMKMIEGKYRDFAERNNIPLEEIETLIKTMRPGIEDRRRQTKGPNTRK